jgi:hypothetical protein
MVEGAVARNCTQGSKNELHSNLIFDEASNADTHQGDAQRCRFPRSAATGVCGRLAFVIKLAHVLELEERKDRHDSSGARPSTKGGAVCRKASSFSVLEERSGCK